MTVLVLLASLGYLGTTFTVSGVAHAATIPELSREIREHAVLPAAAALPAAALLAIFELGVAAVAIRSALQWHFTALELSVLAGCIPAAAVFLFYLRRLLDSPRPPARCGCLPFRAPLSSFSLAPAGGVAVMAGLGLLAGLLHPQPLRAGPDRLAGGGAPWLAVAWGATLAGLVMLLPASAPEPELQR